MTAPAHEHAELCGSLRGSPRTEDRIAADAIDSLHARLTALEAERDLYREATDLLRHSALTYLAALQQNRRSLGRLVTSALTLSPSAVPAPEAVGSTAAGVSSTTTTPDPGQE